MTRREWLQSAGAIAALGWGRPGPQDIAVPAVDAVDHLLLGVSDLDAGIAWFEQRSGVRAVPGGRHPGRGTRNALAALGGRRYLEIIAPDPDQTTYAFHLDVRELETPRLITWAASVTDLDGIVERIRQDGYDVYGPDDGARERPDGQTLRWRTAGLTSRLGAGAIEPVPFLITWASGSAHPSTDSPDGCRLEALSVGHPEPERLGTVLGSLGLAMPVSRQRAVRLSARLETPRGRLDLG